MKLSRLVVALALLTVVPPAAAQEALVCPLNNPDCLCDASYQDCRTPLLNLIRNETVGIDVAFWFMEDLRYSDAIIDRWRAGVPVRVIMDTEANPSYPGNVQALNALKSAGIPMLERTGSGMVHWKTMIFVGQNRAEFSGANFSPHAFVPSDPYRDYIDEVIWFSSDPAIVNSTSTAMNIGRIMVRSKER